MVKSSKQGTAFEIATQGILTPDGLGIATQGFVEPTNIYTPVVGGGVVLGGAALLDVVVDNTAIGGIVISADGASATFSRNGTGATEGGLIIGGSAGLVKNLIFGRGGAKIAKRIREPAAKWTPSEYDPDKHLTPIDYRKKIENAIARAEHDKLTLFAHAASGTLRVQGRAHVVVIRRDLPDGEIIVASCPPLTPIELDLPHVFNNNVTAMEIAELEDHLLLNDILGLGDYTIKTGPKSRFVHNTRKPTGGSAKVNFVSGAGRVKFVTQIEKLQRREDDELMLEVGERTRQELEEEELRLLDIFD
jgi:hypothetical protein